MALNPPRNGPRFYPVTSEVLGFLLLLVYQIYLLKPFLLDAKTTLTHDGFYLVLPVFHYLAKNLYAGFFPYWNYLSHGGEAFYPLVPYFKLLDGFTLSLIYLGKYFTQNIFLLFNWYHYLSFFLMNAGIYACLRPLCSHFLLRFTLMAILLFSSSFLAPFRQPGYLAQFQWTPWIVFYLLKILRDKNSTWSNFLMLGVFMGMTWQAYWFSGTWLFIGCFGTGLCIWNRLEILDTLRSPGIKSKIFVSLSLWLTMLLPNLVLYSEQNHWVSPVRLLPPNYQSIAAQGASMLYELDPKLATNPSVVSFENIKFSGTLSKITDFFQLIYPNGNKKAHPQSTVWGNTSEILIYIGVLPFLISLIGVFWGRENFKYSWLLVLVGSGLIMLGSAGGIHYLLYWIFPPLWFIRHTALFAPIFIFALLYFYTLGFKVLIQFNKNHLLSDEAPLSLAAFGSSTGLAVLLIFLGLLSLHTPILRDKLVFLPILSAIFLIHFLSLKIRKKALFIPLVMAQFFVVFFSCPNRFDYVKYIFWTALIPLFVLILLQYLKSRKFIPQSLFLKLSLGLLLISIFYDLNFYFRNSHYLYRGQSIPDSYFSDSKAFDLTTLKPRIVHSPFPKIPESTHGPIREQSPRYTELIQGTPSAFSQPFGLESDQTFSFDYLLKHRRWSPILLQRNYTDLIYSKIPATLSEEFFTIGQNIFQFKTAVFPLNSALLPSLLVDESNFSRHLFKDSLYLSENIWPPNFLPFLKSDFSFRTVKFSPNEIVLELNSSRRGYLYWADGFDTHWKALIQNKPAPILRANINFKAIPVNSGQQSLRLYYDPRNFRIALWLFLMCTILGVFGALLLYIFSELKALFIVPVRRVLHV